MKVAPAALVITSELPAVEQLKLKLCKLLPWQAENTRAWVTVGTPATSVDTSGPATLALTVTVSVVLCGLTHDVDVVWQANTKLVVVTAVVEITKAAKVND